MKSFLYLLSFVFVLGCSSSSDSLIETDDGQVNDPEDPTTQSLYFPANTGSAWETTAPEDLGWKIDAILDLDLFLEDSGTKAFIILKDGKLVIERYFQGMTSSDNLPWFSAAKTLVAFSVLQAREDGFLNLDDATTDYLGQGWTAMTTEQENAITLRNQLTMTTGADYNIGNWNCTDPDCLDYLNSPGSFWFYHNAFYTLLQPVLDEATPQDFDTYFETELKNRIGMDGNWVKLGFLRVYFSTAKSMARFGLLNLNKGTWNTEELLPETSFTEMTTTSQNLNKSYGYFWWLNGKENYKVPVSTEVFGGSLVPNAPDDMVAGLGANDQKLYVVPSKNLVVVRLGDNAGMELLGPSSYDNRLWEKINAIFE